MDERQLEDLQRQLLGRSWMYDDPASHRAGVEDAVRVLRDELVGRPVPVDRVTGTGTPRRVPRTGTPPRVPRTG